MGTNEAPVVRAPCPDLGPGEHVLPEAVGHYLARVLRLRAGATFVAFDGARAVEWDATVLAVSGGAVRVRFASPRPALRPAPVAWVHGLPKGDKADAIVRDLTELGATLIAFATTEHAVVTLDARRAEARGERWRRIADEAARQCGRGDAPVVSAVRSWSDALLAAQAHAGALTRAFVLYERAAVPLAPALAEAVEVGAPLAFAAGPEGGLSAAEVDAARAAGFQEAGLGPRILRTETVPAAVLGAVLVARQLRPRATG